MIEITYKNVVLDVDYDIQTGDPDGAFSKDTFNLTRVLCGGQDMEYLLTVDQFCAIETAAAEKYFER